MYHVTEIISIITLLYLLSYFLCRSGLYSSLLHRKIWNTVLAVTFLFTASAGLFLALQINYKWDIPLVKQLLKWHAEFGIGLAVTGIFHLIWHLSYFKKFFSPAGCPEHDNEIQNGDSSGIRTNLFIVGLVSSSFQLLLLREIISIAGGYELIAGIFLGSWLTGSAAGSALAGKSGLTDLKKINLIFALSPLISLLFLIVSSYLLMNTGETPSLLKSIMFTFLVDLPFCLVSGFTFIKLTYAAGKLKNYRPGKSFSVETAGGIFAGLLIPVLTSGFINTYQAVLLIILLSMAYVLNNFFLSGKSVKLFSSAIIAIMASAVIILKPDVFFRQLLMPAVHVTSSQDTQYGNITQAVYKGDKSIYYNQRLIEYNSDATEREENIHYSMLQRDRPEKVILISGPLGSLMEEILKYPVREITYIERDPVLSGLQLEKKKSDESMLEVRNADAVRFLQKSNYKSDVVILLMPPPTTLMLNRYYTTEFFTIVKKNLLKDGVFVCSPGPADLYLNKGALSLCSSVYNSLASVFRYVRPVAGNKLYFLASDEKLSVSFCTLTENRGINNLYVSSDYLSDDILTKKSDEISSLLNPLTKQNTNALPVGFFYQQSYNLSKSNNEKIPALLVLAAILALPVITIRKKDLTMFFSASALAGFEIISIFVLQIIAGNMYQLTGLIISMLMTGLAVGAGCELNLPGGRSILGKGILLVLFYLVAALLFNLMMRITSGPLATIIVAIVVFIPALVTGQLYRDLTTGSSATAGFQATYSADLTGSAFGFILISGFVVPVMGITIAVIISAFLIFTGIIIGTIGNK